MGMLDALMKNPQLIGDVAKFAADNPQIAKAAMSLLGSGRDGNDGLADIVGSLRSGGLGDVVASWLGNGDNKAVAPQELRSALGDERIAKFADQAGISGTEASALLAGILPQLVDKLTPDGQLPDAGGLNSMLNGLMGALKNRA